jgi:hypothetical protein
MLLTQDIALAFSRACAKTGNNIAANIAIIAITTSNSISVNAFCVFFIVFPPHVNDLILLKNKVENNMGCK